MIKKLVTVCLVAFFIVVINVTVTFVGIDGGITVDEECLLRCLVG